MNLNLQLTQLETAEIVRRSNEPELAYLFKHALTQETTYASLLKRSRHDIHLQVARAIESQYADHLDEFAALLAQHYAAGEDDTKTLEYATRAGDANARIYANSEAVAHYSLAIDAAKRNPTPSPPFAPETLMPLDGQDGTILREIYVKRGRALELSGRFSEALTGYDEMGSFAREHGDGRLELASLVARATLFSTHTPLNDGKRAQEFSAQALALARRIGDRLSESRILWTQMLFHVYSSGDAEAGVRLGEESLVILRNLNRSGTGGDRAAREQLAYTLNDLLYAYSQVGKLEDGLAARVEARDLWRELDNKPMLADNLAGVSLAQWSFGQPEAALETADEAYTLAESIGNLWSMAQGRAMRGYALAELGRFIESIAALRASDEYATAVGTGGAMLAARCGLASEYLSIGMIDLGLAAAERGLEGAKRYIADWHLWPHAVLVRLHLARGDLERARRIADECGLAARDRKLVKSFMPGVAAVVLGDAALALANKEFARVHEIADAAFEYLNGSARNYLPDLYLLQAEAVVEQGDLEEADRILREARSITDKARRMRWQVLGKASSVARARGNRGEADRLREAARAEAQFIAQNLDEEMRAVFVNLPDVRQLT